MIISMLSVANHAVTNTSDEKRESKRKKSTLLSDPSSFSTNVDIL